MMPHSMSDEAYACWIQDMMTRARSSLSSSELHGAEQHAETVQKILAHLRRERLKGRRAVTKDEAAAAYTRATRALRQQKRKSTMTPPSMSDEEYAGRLGDWWDRQQDKLATAADTQDEAGHAVLSNVLDWAAGEGGDAAQEAILGENGNGTVAADDTDTDTDADSTGMNPLMIGGLVVAGLFLTAGIGYVALGN